MTHYEKFAQELKPGDERYIYDNSGPPTDIKLCRHGVMPPTADTKSEDVAQAQVATSGQGGTGGRGADG